MAHQATKLWQKESSQNPEWLEAFTKGSDAAFDLLLARHDVKGSMAHAAMLAETGLLTHDENTQLQRELARILQQIEDGGFVIEEGVEDVHSQVELMLTQQLGDIGKKIHSARSRNDQVLTDIKLFIKAELQAVASHINTLFELLLQLSETHKHALLPGYTHLQVAMPSSFGLWFGAYAESLGDDLELLIAAYNVANKNPLGSGAGYGSSLPINRQSTTGALHFESMNYNVVYAQMTRGKTEKITAMALASVAATLSKLAMDACLYLSQNFNFISFPEALTTGSSIMPHKKNPDVFELIRGKCNRLQALPNELTLLLSNLPSGYHRDLQLTKECLFPGLRTLQDCLVATTNMLQHISVRTDIMSDEKYRYAYSVEQVNALVNEGLPFREAYKQVGEAVQKGSFAIDLSALQSSEALKHTHEGSLGNLMTEEIRLAFKKKLGQISA